tara:strand:+ start:408 stop:638 length:231 start_codon:yes stop_codon:yes gene_type:complete
MNLLLRPLEDVNDVTWSIVISLIILLAGVTYYIYTIMNMAFQELEKDDGIPQRETNPNQSERCESGSGDSTSETSH